MFYQAANEKGLEGIIAKHSQSAYEAGKRSPQWLKMKSRITQECAIVGFTEPGPDRRYFGALVLGIFEGANLKYIGRVGSRFTAKTLKYISDKLEPLILKECPFKVKPNTIGSITCVKPEIMCEVTLSGWTDAAIMRHPVFLRLREDTHEVMHEPS